MQTILTNKAGLKGVIGSIDKALNDHKRTQSNLQDFYATCSEAEVIVTPKCKYKHVNMFGEKTLIFWRQTGRISTRNGFVIPE